VVLTMDLIWELEEPSPLWSRSSSMQVVKDFLVDSGRVKSPDEVWIFQLLLVSTSGFSEIQ
jgi:hypothetical protein